MAEANTKDVKQLWEAGQIRVLILASLTIQALLTFFAPYRKSVSQSLIKLLIWVLYLIADVVAIYIIGLIQSSRGHHFAQKPALLAFWTPFLLLHLGGPDTITALALEDNELWRRHALQLTTQVAITTWVFVRSLKRPNYNPLWLPTILMFLDGVIKYFERTYALFLASKENFRESLMKPPEPGPNYARLMEEFYSAKRANIPTVFEGKDDQEKVRVTADAGQQPTVTGATGTDNSLSLDQPNDDHNRLVLYAHQYYEMCKILLADGFLSLKDRDQSRMFFLSRNLEEAFEIMEIELNLIYDAFYTKSFLLKKKRAVARLLCFFCVVGSLVLFCFQWKHLDLHETDVIVTYILFAGAIALDISAAIMFVFSDWWVIICYTNKYKLIKGFMICVLSWSRWARRPESKRWSKTMSSYNLLNYCFKNPSSLNWYYWGKRCGMKSVRDFFKRLTYVDKQKKLDFTKFIKFIFKDIRRKAELCRETGKAKQVYEARGNLFLHDDYYLASECLSPWTVDVEYEESVLIWHLATDICYHTADNNIDKSAPEVRFSKALSDYMLYLVIWQQTLLSSVLGMSETRFRDTCAEAQKFNEEKFGNTLCDHFQNMMSANCPNCSRRNYKSPQKEGDFLKEFCKEVMKVKAAVEPIIAKGDKSKSVLFDACRLAHQLRMFGEKQWDITSKVWLELLCYAAARCEPRYHIAQLSKGGELITFVWLYMAHLGFGERFLQNQGFGWTTLIIKK